ncbi:o-succinylbenzoate synthase [Rhodohalobacter sp.]|uniref:o-succinylbenzoate synthase n=1 Tax=Rhodohalobacter sp. TaxID=1974210 RepID=UPI002ACD4169|nr:o-succinylbenzoate synthase [Rhodohalobacter sp.]MDZ7757830.1 o-succinylbenzoate synthase [Rhodohalobacter sp.]
MIEIFTYRLPFSKPFVTGSGVFHHREGLLIRYSDDSTEVISEAAPLPGFSTESLEEVKTTVTDQKESLDIFFSQSYSLEELKTFLQQFPKLPSLQFALSFLGIQILSERSQRSLFDLFEVKYQPKVLVNDVLPIQDVEETIHHFKKSYDSGFRTFKIKSGYPVDQLVKTLKALSQTAGQDCRFRVDANQSWPADQFSEITEQLGEFNIEYIEEPCHNSDIQTLANFNQKSTIPIALDESIKNIDHLKVVLKKLPETIIVIKPTVLGNLFDLFETLARHRTHFNRIVVTTALESSVGRKAVTSVASLIGDPTMAHGLNTGRFFKTDLSNENLISNGKLKLPESGFCSTKIEDLNNSYYQVVD